MNRQELERFIFTADGATSVHFTRVIAANLPEFRYSFTGEDEFTKALNEGLNRGMKIYWREMLFRAHLTSVITILRHNKWVDGILTAADQPNYFAFAASFRGLIESAADSLDALRVVPETLADHFPAINSVFEGKSGSNIYFAEHLENMLIHFSHGRKVSAQSGFPDFHKAKTSKEYITILQNAGQGVIHDCYAHLCEITHPALTSVAFFEEITPDGGTVTITQNSDLLYLKDFVRAFSGVMPNVFQLSINSALLALAVLNHFPIVELHTPIINRMQLDSIPAWKRIAAKIGAQ